MLIIINVNWYFVFIVKWHASGLGYDNRFYSKINNMITDRKTLI